MELTIQNLIKIILGIAVVVLVILGVYFFFNVTVIDFFKNFIPDEIKTENLLLSVLE